MDIAILFPFLLLIGVMWMMSRSAKNRQRQAEQMRDSMEPGTGVRTIGGMYALVEEVREDSVLLEVSSGVHVVYAKNAINAVLEPEEYERIVNGDLPEGEDTPVVPDDASSLTESTDLEREERVELDKSDAEGEPARAEDESDASESATTKDSGSEGENGSKKS